MALSKTFLGRCKPCNGTVRVEAPEVSRVKAYLGYGRYETRVTRQLPNGDRVEGYDRFFARCWCGRSIEFKRIHGHKNDEPCGAKCLAATGPSCECSCGGKNHGGAHEAVAQ